MELNDKVALVTGGPAATPCWAGWGAPRRRPGDVLLCSTDTITGQTIVVDGGMPAVMDFG